MNGIAKLFREVLGSGAHDHVTCNAWQIGPSYEALSLNVKEQEDYGQSAVGFDSEWWKKTRAVFEVNRLLCTTVVLCAYTIAHRHLTFNYIITLKSWCNMFGRKA